MSCYVYEEVINAKEGSKEAFIKLVNYYEDDFCKKIEKIYGKGYEEKAKKLLPEIIKYYIDSNIKASLGRYLSIRAESCFNERINKIDLLNSDNPEHKKLVHVYYTNALFEYMKDCTSILTKEEMIKLAYDYLKFKMDLMDKEDITPSKMCYIIFNEKKYYEDEEKLLMRYVIVEGINNKILNYFINKYSYIINEYNISKEEYDIEVSNTLLNLEKLGYSFESKLKKQIIKDGFKKKITSKVQKDKIIKEDIRNLSNEEQDKEKEKYFYIKEKIFTKYKGICEDVVLRQMIEEKFDDFFNAYINGTTKIYLSSYLIKRLTMHFDVMKKNYDFENSFTIEEKQSNMLENEYLINTYINKFNGYYPVKKDIKSIYIDSCNLYYKKQRTSSFYEFISNELRNAINDLNSKYDINYLNNLFSQFKDVALKNNLLSKDLLEEVFENWIKYYLNNNIYQDISIDEYMFNNFKYYDEEKIREILKIKKEISRGK